MMSIFHYTEYLAIAWTNPKTLTIDSFILNHSLHYALAAIASWVEFLVEVYFCPGLKEFRTIMFIGTILCVFGELLRKFAILTAHSNFNHVVSFKKKYLTIKYPTKLQFL